METIVVNADEFIIKCKNCKDYITEKSIRFNNYIRFDVKVSCENKEKELFFQNIFFGGKNPQEFYICSKILKTSFSEEIAIRKDFDLKYAELVTFKQESHVIYPYYYDDKIDYINKCEINIKIDYLYNIEQEGIFKNLEINPTYNHLVHVHKQSKGATLKNNLKIEQNLFFNCSTYSYNSFKNKSTFFEYKDQWHLGKIHAKYFKKMPKFLAFNLGHLVDLDTLHNNLGNLEWNFNSIKCDNNTSKKLGALWGISVHFAKSLLIQDIILNLDQDNIDYKRIYKQLFSEFLKSSSLERREPSYVLDLISREIRILHKNYSNYLKPPLCGRNFFYLF